MIRDWLGYSGFCLGVLAMVILVVRGIYLVVVDYPDVLIICGAFGLVAGIGGAIMTWIKKKAW